MMAAANKPSPVAMGEQQQHASPSKVLVDCGQQGEVSFLGPIFI
jgi:hypothetical protein